MARRSPSTPSWSAPARRRALLITEGFRDIYEIGRVNRPGRLQPVLPASTCRWSSARCASRSRERMRADGEVLTSRSTRTQVRALGARAARRRASRRSRSCSCIRYRNPAHEQRAKADPRARTIPSIFVSRLARAVAGVPRVRAHLDGGRQRLYRAARSPLSRRDRARICASAGLRRRRS